ncbi:MAG: C40 family peptidase [Mucilaginibacter sp.]|uniref:C40 family peptidase n=1 Tax=Mucilaginibacter sp. TaxID=1882438 RepID=UPI003265EDAC
MRKYLAVFGIVFLCSALLLVNPTYAGKIKRSHKAKTDNTSLNTNDVCADDLLGFAQTLIGTRYRSSSSSPVSGFDCSGFVSYVFKNFNFNVPRSSCEFISVGEKIKLVDAKPGDIILFTGTSKRSRRIGHIAIMMSNQESGVTFIHSTSGKEHGVTISNMDERYKHRFIQVIRLLKQNDQQEISAFE